MSDAARQARWGRLTPPPPAEPSPPASRRAASRLAVSLAVLLAAVAVVASPLAARPARADAVRSGEWQLAAIGAKHAWRHTRGRGVTVALLDTGAYPKHVDLSGSVTVGPDYVRGSSHHPWGPHGTASAGLIAGHGHGAHHAAGVIGVAPAATVLSIRVARPGRVSEAAAPAAVAKGIRYAVAHHAKVIAVPLTGTIAARGSAAERAAVRSAVSHGVVVVAAAGDNGRHGDRATYPAAYPGVLAVGAAGPHGGTPGFSNHRDNVRVTAPGYRIPVPVGARGHRTSTGTAVSCAITAGVVALVRAYTPGLTGAQVAKVIRAAADDHHGVVDASGALAGAHKLAAGDTGGHAGPTDAASPRTSEDEAASKREREVVFGTCAGIVILVLLVSIIALRRRRRGRDGPPLDRRPPRRDDGSGRGPGPSGGRPGGPPRSSAPPHPMAQTEAFFSVNEDGVAPAASADSAARRPGRETAVRRPAGPADPASRAAEPVRGARPPASDADPLAAPTVSPVTAGAAGSGAAQSGMRSAWDEQPTDPLRPLGAKVASSADLPDLPVPHPARPAGAHPYEDGGRRGPRPDSGSWFVRLAQDGPDTGQPDQPASEATAVPDTAVTTPESAAVPESAAAPDTVVAPDAAGTADRVPRSTIWQTAEPDTVGTGVRGRDPSPYGLGRGTRGWAQAAGWGQRAAGDDESDAGWADGDDEDDRHL